MKIDLSRGLVALVDDADAALVAGYKWFAVPGGRTMYARSYQKAADGTRKLIWMHRLIMGEAPGKIVDHKDGDGLNNARANLRHCVHMENLRNQRAQEGRKSPFKGVLVRLGRQRGASFVAQIQQGRERLKIGSYDSEYAAARAYDSAARLFHGQFARTNKDLGLYEQHPDRTSEDFGINPNFRPNFGERRKVRRRFY